MNQENLSEIQKIELEIAKFKQSMNDWIMFLNQQNKDLRERMTDLERRLSKLEIEGQLRF